MSEVHQKMKKCKANHYYDANTYSTCPFCSGALSVGATGDPFGSDYGSQGTPPTVTPGLGADPVNVNPNGGQTIYPFAGDVINGDSSVTAPPFPNPAASNNNEKMGVTQQIITDSEHKDGYNEEYLPCVGWVVAIEGPSRGRDYRVHAGYNFLGRRVGDIVIQGDDTISGERDSSITYVYQTKKFYIAHESGRNVLLVNNIPVMGGGTELHNYDIITIGNTKLIFIALCGEQFSWEDRTNA